jgi:hypothetical protein
VKGLCTAHACSLTARVHVTLTEGDRFAVCVPHWGDVLRDHDGAIRSMRLMPLPKCFVARCRSTAVTIVKAQTDAHPVCQHHLDNLSWVEAAGPPVPKSTEWNHG